MIIIWTLVFFVSLYSLVRSANIFTIQASKIGLAFGMSSFIVGATIVAMGTSLPELVSSLFAIKSGITEFVADKVVGANIANTLLILGAGIFFTKNMLVETSIVRKTLPFFVLSGALLTFFAYDGVITRVESLVLFLFFILFFVLSVKSKQAPEDKEEMQIFREQFKTSMGTWRYLKVFKYVAILIGSGFVLALSANFLIESLTYISFAFNISSSAITVIIVSLGASLPEAMTSLSAIRLKNYGMAIGNILGSSVFNIFLIVGFSGLFTDLEVSDLVLDVGLIFLAISALLTVIFTLKKDIKRWEGALMLIIYFVFILKIVNLI